MRNADVRIAAKNHNIKLWEIADALDMTDSCFSRKLRYELDEREKKRLLSVIADLAVKKELEANAEYF